MGHWDTENVLPEYALVPASHVVAGGVVYDVNTEKRDGKE